MVIQFLKESAAKLLGGDIPLMRDIPFPITATPFATTGTAPTIVAKRRKKAKARVRTKKGRARDWRFISKQKHEKAYQKRRKKLGKKTYGRKYKTKKRAGIHYTKKGQPYKILASGKARFIKKSKGRGR
ncbi:hypothetical protein ES703_92502 [subsurface metagenome]